jgi:hypothetical protein
VDALTIRSAKSDMIQGGLEENFSTSFYLDEKERIKTMIAGSSPSSKLKEASKTTHTINHSVSILTANDHRPIKKKKGA